MAFLKTDVEFASRFPNSKSGTTFSAAAIQFDHSDAAPEVSLTVAWVGDSSVIVCDSDGYAVELTRHHYASVPIERERVVASGGRIVEQDGMPRVLASGRHASLEPTRSIGDLDFKRAGVFAEPEIIVLHRPAKDLAFLVLATDGVTQSITAQEIVDIIKGHKTPSAAAETLVEVAESLNVDDNKTCLILRLYDWPAANSGRMEDFTRELRERRLAKYMRAGPDVKPHERAEDEDLSIYLARSGSEQTLRPCGAHVFGLYKPLSSDNVAFTAGQIRQANGYSVDDWQLDPDQKNRTEQWKRDRQDRGWRERETARMVDKFFALLVHRQM